MNGGAVRSFSSPFSSASVLYLRDAQLGSSPTPTSVGTTAGTTTNTPATTSNTITIGETNVLSTDDAGNGNLLVSQQVSLSQSATIQSLSFYVATASGHLRLGIYDANRFKWRTGSFEGTDGCLHTDHRLEYTECDRAGIVESGYVLAGVSAGEQRLAFPHGTEWNGALVQLQLWCDAGSYSTSPSSGTYHWSFYATLSTGAATASTPTPVSPNNTFTPTVTNVASPTYTPTNIPVNVPSATFTFTPMPTVVDPATETPTYTTTALPTDAATASLLPSATNTPVWTPTDSVADTGPVPSSRPQILKPVSLTSKTGTTQALSIAWARWIKARMKTILPNM